MTDENTINQKLNSIGLLSGKMGFSIASFVLGSEKDDKMLIQKAQGLLDEIAENLTDTDSLTYGQGLAGIGYGIEWLAQNGFIHVNSDEILSDIDDELYKAVVYVKAPNASLSEGSLGLALYFLKRLMAKNLGTHRYRTICLNECLILLSDELLDFLLNEENGICLKDTVKLTEEEYLMFSQSLIFFQKLLKLNINRDSAEKGICGIITCIQKIFMNETLFSRSKFPYLIHAYGHVAFKLNDNNLMIDAKKVFEFFLTNIKPSIDDAFSYHIVSRLCKMFNIAFDFEQPIYVNAIDMDSLLLSPEDTYNLAEIWLLN